MAKKKVEKAEETVEEVEVEKAEETVEEKTVPLYELSRDDNGFILRSGEQKELPENPSNRLLERIDSGFIREVK